MAMRRAQSHNRGISLTELLVAFVIITVGSGILMAFLKIQHGANETSSLQGDIRMRAQVAVETISNDIRAATRTGAVSPPKLSIPAAPGNTTMTFYLPADSNDANTTIVDANGDVEWGATPIQYVFDAGNSQLSRVEGATTKIIAAHVSSVVFSDQAIDATLASDEVRLQLTLQESTPQGRALTSTAVGLVKLRN